MKDRCHFIGIGGIGMSSLARILLEKPSGKRIEVSGSDRAESYITEGLKNSGASISIGHHACRVSSDMSVIYSTDIKEDNPEYQQALQLKCSLLHRSDLLAHLMKDYIALTVTGTHGKTTTSALLATVLIEAGLDPCFAIGGMLPHFQTNGRYGRGKFFIAEADESDGSFLKYSSSGAIVTNIDLDHMNHFRTENELINAFEAFCQNVTSPEHLFWCGDDRRLVSLKLPGMSYGFNSSCDAKISNFKQKEWLILFDLDFDGKKYPAIEVSLIGRHNALNAAAVFALALKLGLEENRIRFALKSFSGVSRRCEMVGDCQGILFIDDYAHHPTEVLTTLAGIRKATKEKRLIAIFQPHRYSRTKDCLGSFGGIFRDVDELIMTDIYGAGEPEMQGFSYRDVLDEVQNCDPMLISRYVSRENLASFLTSFLRPHDVVVTLGAGDITKVSPEVIKILNERAIQKIKVGVAFGGISSEHEVSLLSATHVYQSLDPKYYDVRQFGIKKDGQWVCSSETLESFKTISPVTSQSTFKRKSSAPEKKQMMPFSQEVLHELNECDVIFPVLHGPYGEDGTIQGFFEMLGKAYVGCDHRSAAICMDKVVTKKLMLLNDIATAPFVDFSRSEWLSSRDEFLLKIQQTLHYPLFVKPVHLGSSVGVVKVEEEKKLQDAIEYAFRYDTILIIETGIVGARECEFAVLGNEEIQTFPPGEVITHGQVYDYDAKYGPGGMESEPCADLPLDWAKKGMDLALKAYRLAGCCGMARLDFFLDPTGKFWLNEINPIPGFTKISLYPKICEANGLSSYELMDQLILLALQRKRQKERVSH